MTPLAVVAALSFLALAAIARTQHVFSLDYTVEAIVQGGRHPLLESPMRALTRLGSGWALAALTALGWLGLWRLGHPLTRFVPTAAAGAVLVDVLTKWVVSRPRPRGGAYGFPSVHAFGATIVFGAVIYVLWTSGVPRAARWLGTLLACLLVAGVAWSRLYLKVHWLSDVVGGLTGGLAYLLVVLIVIERRFRPTPT